MVLSQVDLDLQLPRAQLEGKGMARPSQHLVRVALVGDLCKGLTLAHHASETLRAMDRWGDESRPKAGRWRWRWKLEKKNAIPARFCHLWVAIPFQTWTCFQTFPNNSKDPARTCARTLGRHRVIEKGKPGQRRGHGYPNLECLWNMDAAAAWLEYMKKRYLIKSFNDQIAGCQLQTLSLFCGTLGESSKLNLTLCCQKNRISHSAPQRNRNLQVWSLQHDPKFQG